MVQGDELVMQVKSRCAVFWRKCMEAGLSDELRLALGKDLNVQSGEVTQLSRRISQMEERASAKG